MAKIGYIRVSTEDQDYQYQQSALTNAGCTQIFADKESGTKRERPGLVAALKAVKPGDEFYVWKLDRAARSVRHTLEIAEYLDSQNVAFKSLTENIDTKSPIGKMFFTILAAFAQMERDNLSERTKAGLHERVKQGVKLGPPRQYGEDVIVKARTLRRQGMGYLAIARELKLSKSTAKRFVADLPKG